MRQETRREEGKKGEHILEGVSKKDRTTDRIPTVIEEGIQGATETGWGSFGGWQGEGRRMAG